MKINYNPYRFDVVERDIYNQGFKAFDQNERCADYNPFFGLDIELEQAFEVGWDNAEWLSRRGPISLCDEVKEILSK